MLVHLVTMYIFKGFLQIEIKIFDQQTEKVQYNYTAVILFVMY